MRVFMIIGIVLTVVGVYFLYQTIQPSTATGIGADAGHTASSILALTFLPMGIIFTLVGYFFVRSSSRSNKILQQGVAGTATILGLASTNMYINEQPVAKLTMSIQLPGRAPYTVEKREVIPMLALGMIAPGKSLPVAVDPANPQSVVIDWSGQTQNRPMGQGAMGMNPDAMPSAGMPAPNTLSAMGSAPVAPNTLGGATTGIGLGVLAGGAAPSGSTAMDFNWDASGQPIAGQTAAVIGAVRSGALPTIPGSAAQLLATGTPGTAVVTTAQPMGKTVRDINPAAEASHLNDPMWLFTVEVMVAGEMPFPAVFGHRVPLDKVSSVAPGANLAVAVNMADRNQEVAIDWDKTPLSA